MDRTLDGQEATDQARADDPPKRHDGPQQDGQARPVCPGGAAAPQAQVARGQLDRNHKDLDAKHEPSELLHEAIAEALLGRVQDAGALGAEEDAADEGQG